MALVPYRSDADADMYSAWIRQSARLQFVDETPYPRRVPLEEKAAPRRAITVNGVEMKISLAEWSSFWFLPRRFVPAFIHYANNTQQS